MTETPTPISVRDSGTVYSSLPEITRELTELSDTFAPIGQDPLEHTAYSLPESRHDSDSLKSGRSDRMLTFDLHPLYASILQDGATIREGEVLGLDGDLRRVLLAPFDGTIRLLVTGTGGDRRVRVFLSEQKERRELFAAGRR